MNLNILKDTPPWDWPSDTSDMLLSVLRDSQAEQSDRITAAELAGSVCANNEDLVGTLRALVGCTDESEELRERAAISLGPALEVAEMAFGGFDDESITESTIREIQRTFRTLYMDARVPKGVRRRILEASVRNPQDWHEDVIRTAHSSSDEEWTLTAVFAMRWIRGFDEQILEALRSTNEDVQYQAVLAAGNWEVAAAWPHVEDLLLAGDTDKPLLLAAIEVAADLRPDEASLILVDLAESDDEDVAAAALEAMAMAGQRLDDDDDDYFDDDDDDDDD